MGLKVALAAACTALRLLGRNGRTGSGDQQADGTSAKKARDPGAATRFRTVPG